MSFTLHIIQTNSLNNTIEMLGSLVRSVISSSSLDLLYSNCALVLFLTPLHYHKSSCSFYFLNLYSDVGHYNNVQFCTYHTKLHKSYLSILFMNFSLSESSVTQHLISNSKLCNSEFQYSSALSLNIPNH
jgi:hypothetical protein